MEGAKKYTCEKENDYLNSNEINCIGKKTILIMVLYNFHQVMPSASWSKNGDMLGGRVLKGRRDVWSPWYSGGGWGMVGRSYGCMLSSWMLMTQGGPIVLASLYYS